jgi:hypothetical protein
MKNQGVLNTRCLLTVIQPPSATHLPSGTIQLLGGLRLAGFHLVFLGFVATQEHRFESGDDVVELRAHDLEAGEWFLARRGRSKHC